LIKQFKKSLEKDTPPLLCGFQTKILP